ncbi:MmgE/PrpD family protein [Mammaliicoccus sciuri]|uniref:MmgE/PrpD family protein n=1 Tax=Mammaliicoccus sciuri TaxID=1296 RepID=UPI00197D4630|nr:MmgE/PrpD family protein [Mammaliicoccus sciuri]MCJ1759199.1 MmgE/PrpD family protein [Mammaliicoccus sciuri]MEB5676894.1 MmgE/PrpD family protein [Mammaliicoccus sciuri]MEB6251632.1 MmgE/PrpD family protein [Mammaliicoccus sciuri]WQJ41973.1 MmgE/PrpD family protein [Mammaliicoccus sciuri]
MTDTEALVERIYRQSKHISTIERDNAITGILDFIATTYSANNHHKVNDLISFIQEEEGSGNASIIGYEAQLSPSNAALVNGFIAHILDFDDVHSSMRGHPTAVILPSLLAVAENDTQTFKHFIDSYIIGVEMATQIGETIGACHYEQGWHSTSTIGLLSATVACCYYLNLDAPSFANAIGIAVTQASGLRNQFGSDVKPFHVGLASQKAYLAARISQKRVLEGNKNMMPAFYELFGTSDCSFTQIIENFGDQWSITHPGMWYKLYPCCSANYHLIDAINTIKQTHHISPEKVESVKITFPTNGDAALKFKSPETGLEGAFSAEYVSALLLLNQELTVDQFLNKPISYDVNQLMEKIVRHYDDDIQPSPHALPKNRFTIVEITLVTGEQFKQRVDAPKGSPYKPLTKDEHLTKLKHASYKHWENIHDFYEIKDTKMLQNYIFKGEI